MERHSIYLLNVNKNNLYKDFSNYNKRNLEFFARFFKSCTQNSKFFFIYFKSFNLF